MQEVEVILEKKKFNDLYSSYSVNESVIEKIFNENKLPKIRLKDEDLSSGKLKDTPKIGIIMAKDGDDYVCSELLLIPLLRIGAEIKFITFRNVKELMSDIDGIIIPGGSYDSPAKWYRQKTTSNLSLRSLANLEATKIALKKKMPIFGICAGMQMIVGTLGYDYGTRFYLDLKKETECTENHKDLLNHDMLITKGTKLFGLLKKERMVVNSNHKEAVIFDSIKEDNPLRVSATSPEGIVEAIEIKEYPYFSIGVQWHPEFASAQDNDPDNNKLFEEFVKSAQRYKTNKTTF